MMNVFQSCSDTSDAIPLSTSQELYLKPMARLNISVQLPSLKLPGKSISNWEVMEKLRHYAAPEEFIALKVSKSTLEVVRFEGEIENRSKLPAVLARLDGRSLKLSGFHESLKIRAAEAKADFPTRYTWDSYFRDAKNMNEMKPGERPDTIHITNLPSKWFAAKSDSSKPSEYILRKVFEVFGEVRCVDIPVLDPFRSQMKSYISGIKMFSNNQNMIFEAYVQFKEYICFVKAMDALRGMKLLHKDVGGKTFSASIKVDFDKTKHLSDSSIKRRRVERERLMAKEREREEKERLAREEEERKLAVERKRIEEEKEAKLERQRQREERRKVKQLERLKQREADDMNKKIATEERLLLIAQRRLESFRLLGELFNRLKIAKENKLNKNKDGSPSTKYQRNHKNPSTGKQNDKLEIKEKELREKLVMKFKHCEQNDQTKLRRGASDHPAGSEAELLDMSYRQANDNFDENRGFRHGMSRGGRGGRFPRRRRGNIPFRGNQFPPLPFQSFSTRGGFGPSRGFPRWPRFTSNNRFGEDPPPLIDPFYLESAINNNAYYKYFQKITLGGRSTRSLSRSLSRSRSRSRTYSSRSYSTSRSRSYLRSRSRSYTRSRTRSRTRRNQSRSRSRRRSKTRTRSRSRSQRRSRSKKKLSSCTRSHSSGKSGTKDKIIEHTLTEATLNQELGESVKKSPSLHTWSRSLSRTSSLSWENRKEESATTKSHHKHKREKKKKHKKERKKKRKKDID